LDFFADIGQRDSSQPTYLQDVARQKQRRVDRHHLESREAVSLRPMVTIRLRRRREFLGLSIDSNRSF
jgi:hypothetical protein